MFLQRSCRNKKANAFFYGTIVTMIIEPHKTAALKQKIISPFCLSKRIYISVSCNFNQVSIHCFFQKDFYFLFALFFFNIEFHK